MSIEDFSNVLYVFLIAPLGFALHRVVSHSNRITALEANQKNNLDKLNRIDGLCEDVSYIKGLLKEHIGKEKI